MPSATVWPKQTDVRAFFGEPGGPQATAGMVDLPYPMRIAWDTKSTINRFRCHAKVEKPLERIFAATLKHYGAGEVKRLGLDLFGGCYNFRPMRGSKRWSMHAYGIAVDLDPARNGLHTRAPKAAFSHPEYEPFWRIVEGEGAVSLGRTIGRDFMHFQFARL